MSLQEHWEERSKEFENIPEVGKEVQIIIDFVKDLQPKKILEVGCNYGRELKHLEGLGELYGIDFNRTNVKNANSYVSGTVIFGNAKNMGYCDNSFDFVYTDGLCSHCLPKNLRKILEEIIRVSSKHILLIEYLGTRSGRNLIENCKQFTWVHDYDRLISTLNIVIKYNKEKFFGTDLCKIILLQKEIPKIEKEKIEIKKEEKFHGIKIGKFRLGWNS